jgi:20S proteasome subunit beta 5
MDTLVSRYSRPMFENEGYNQDEQEELYAPIPSLSLRFAMPPIAHVRISNYLYGPFRAS